MISTPSSRVALLFSVAMLVELLAGGCHSAAPDDNPPATMTAPERNVTPPPPAPSHSSDVPRAPDAGVPVDSGMKPPAPMSDAGAAERDDDAGADDLEPLDAGSWVPPDPTCSGRDWQLAPGFLPAKRVDYIADRDMRTLAGGTPLDDVKPYVISSVGTPCATARDRASCMAALLLPTPLARHLVTTSGDSVQTWAFPAALALLGETDTVAEAIWVTIATRGDVGCNATVERDERGFVVTGLPNFNCATLPDGGYPGNVTVRALPNGTTEDVYVVGDGGVLNPCPPEPPATP